MVRPYSAGTFAPMTLNSWMASTEGNTVMPVKPLVEGWVAVRPSTRMSMVALRVPYTDHCMAVSNCCPKRPATPGVRVMSA